VAHAYPLRQFVWRCSRTCIGLHVPDGGLSAKKAPDRIPWIDPSSSVRGYLEQLCRWWREQSYKPRNVGRCLHRDCDRNERKHNADHERLVKCCSQITANDWATCPLAITNFNSHAATFAAKIGNNRTQHADSSPRVLKAGVR